jgi:hypothetical protein
VPGKKITDHQVQKYKQHHLKLSQVAAAAKAGISERSAQRIDRGEALPSQREERAWRTRADPLAPVWDSEVVPLLEADGALNAVTLLEELQRRYPGSYGTAILRTLQRRVRQWRAVHGPEREVFFAQEHPPGRLGLSDFTVCDELEVVVAGVAFPHRIYQFALAHSGWRHAAVFEGGESFIALSTGLQSALWRLGGVPEEHRTDSLSAAFNNLAEKEELTRRYDALCKHYDMRASRCNPGQSQENGSIESRHDSLKTALDQALRLRGSRCFDERAAYEALVATIVARFNARVAVRLVVERATLRPLPQRRTAEYEEVPARVSKYAIFTVRGAQYSAPIDQRQGAREQCFPRATWQRSWPHAHKPCRWTDSDLANLPTLRQTVRGGTCSREAASSTAITMTGKGASSSRWARCATNEGGASPLASACPSVSGSISLA